MQITIPETNCLFSPWRREKKKKNFLSESSLVSYKQRRGQFSSKCAGAEKKVSRFHSFPWPMANCSARSDRINKKDLDDLIIITTQ